MPLTAIHLFQNPDGHSPVLAWLDSLRETDALAYAKCMVVIRRLAAAGYELRRPTADLLRDGIYELRTRHGHVNYRILYFFHGRNNVVLAHALTKEDSIPAADIARALTRKQAHAIAPELHTHERDLQ